jgi:glycosyltransferase involved in cell wall biosynthesis
MKISILSPVLSSNCVGRAYLLAKILQRHYKVELIGPIYGHRIWKPVAGDKDIVYKLVKIKDGFINPYWQVRKLIRKIDGDVIYVSKPLFTSFGIGLLKKFINPKPLILDIDDWEMGFIKEKYKNNSLWYNLKSLGKSFLYPYRMDSYFNNLIGEKLIYLADEITVSNRFLQDKFGGTIIYHARDTADFDPEKFDKDLIRERHNIEQNKKIIMFFGTPRTYKGIEDLIKAVSLIQDQDTLLIIVGIKESEQDLVRLATKELGEKFRGFGLQPFQKVPEFLAMADIIVIPQRRNLGTVGQIPAKIFDAMAMAKPIIATNVGDIPEILNGCGYIVEPENPKHLAKAIQYVLDHPKEAKERGCKARQICKDKYSWDAMEKVLKKVFNKYSH